MAQDGRPKVQANLKPDGSIVTNLDREIETFLRKELLDLVPNAGFWGEEFGFSPQTDQGLWLLDPIDGTSNFRFGQPLWGVTLGYAHQGVLQFGATILPDLNLLLTATKGGGAFLNGEPLPPIAPGEILSHELVSNGDSKAALQTLSPGKMRHIGAFCVEILFVCTQSCRALTTGNINLYDCAGGIVAARELGAEIRHIDGRPFNEADWMTGHRADPFYIGPANSNFPFGTCP